MKNWIFCFICLLLLVPSFPTNSFAYEYGDNPKWYTPNFAWNYRDLKSTYRDNFAAAVYYWDATSTPLNFDQMEDKYISAARLRAKGSYLGNVGYNAIVAHHHSSNYDSITANYSYMDSKVGVNENWITGVFGHEIGHTIGLDHVTDPYRLMCTSKDGRKVYKPTSDEVNGANALY